MAWRREGVKEDGGNERVPDLAQERTSILRLASGDIVG